ncbi:MAG: TerB N-terminal domain-containing protein [Clostridium sp.]|jgi:hypothetical protein|nr:TerB N-terminal domain-containing protein [Clostridium sp.]
MINLEDGFHEIEFGTPKQNPLPTQKIPKPAYDPIRERFLTMREIARKYFAIRTISFHLQKAKTLDDQIFVEQGRFMADFEDDISDISPISFERPTYQLMNYHQLRTYFSWRTKTRRQKIQNIAFPYVLLYCYELVNNIGVSTPKEGFLKLLSIWKNYRGYHPQLNTFIQPWLKDYHIFYDLPQPFEKIVEKYNLQAYYGMQTGETQLFDLYRSFSTYYITGSHFFTKHTQEMIEGCFHAVLNDIRREFQKAGMDFESVFFHPTQKLPTWKPFLDAPFYSKIPQRNRSVLIGTRELYLCSNQLWTHSQILTTTKGRKFITYVLKKMESLLRELTNYRTKITAKIDIIDPATQRVLLKKGIQIDELITASVKQYYRELTQIVVQVDDSILERIRSEALETQERLAIPEDLQSVATLQAQDTDDLDQLFMDSSDTTIPLSYEDFPSIALPLEHMTSPDPSANPWQQFKSILTPNERAALTKILQGEDLMTFAQQIFTMPELLIDEINQKAQDCIGDQLLDEDAGLYEDYQDQVKELLQ